MHQGPPQVMEMLFFPAAEQTPHVQNPQQQC